VLDAQRRALGAEGNGTLHVLHHLANLLLQQGPYEQAETECRASLPTLQRVLGADHIDTLFFRQRLADGLARRGCGSRPRRSIEPCSLSECGSWAPITRHG
jgi:hypothetical protein